MVRACILICSKMLRTNRAVEATKKLSGVKNAYPVHGRWDIVAQTGDLDLKQIADLSVKIYKIPGVEIVETLVELPGA